MTQNNDARPSVHQRRLQLARSDNAKRRNPRLCACMTDPDIAPRWVGKRRSGALSSQHGARHGAWHHQGCPHSTLAATTGRGLDSGEQARADRMCRLYANGRGRR